MNICPKCRINVGGKFHYCPLCQNELQGEESDYYFPAVRYLRKKSFWYKIQLFVSLALMIISLFLDFMFGLHGRIHWSVIAASTVVICQYVMKRLIRKQSANICYYIFNIGIAASLVLFVFSYYLDFLDFSVSYIYPSLLISLAGVMFAFALTDKSGNVMVYLLSAIAMCVLISIIVLVFAEPHFRLLWQICLMMTSVVLTGTLIFKGSKALNELYKRLHM